MTDFQQREIAVHVLPATDVAIGWSLCFWHVLHRFSTHVQINVTFDLKQAHSSVSGVS